MISGLLMSKSSIKPEIENHNCENQILLNFKIIPMSIKPLPKNDLPVVKTPEVDLLDLLFQNRNKEYGAYQLRKLYNRYMTPRRIIDHCTFGCASRNAFACEIGEIGVPPERHAEYRGQRVPAARNGNHSAAPSSTAS